VADPSRLNPVAAALTARVAARLPNSPLVVALSGGADSAVLAWAVTQCSDQVRAVSVDHGMPASAALMSAAAEISAKLELPHQIVVADPSPDSETALRENRYAALEGAVADDEIIVTGHTLDDQAETVLGNILRGTGVSGLGGIPAARGRFRRPMLDIARSEIRDIAKALGLPFMDDPQNEDAAVRRNRIRQETLPSLADQFNPRLVEALARLASSAVADDVVLEARASRVQVTHRDGALVIPAAVLATLPLAVSARVVRRALRMVRGPYPGTSNEILSVLQAVDGAAVTIGSGVDVHREGPWLVLVAADTAVPSPARIEIGAEVGFGDWTIAAGAGSPVIGRFSATIARPEQLVVRTALASERIAIGGGSKRIGDAMAEAGIAQRVRPMWPVIEADGTIAWIAGVRAAPYAAGAATITVRARRKP
jgi:tRNA(Ile)-lysidine synthase